MDVSKLGGFFQILLNQLHLKRKQNPEEFSRRYGVKWDRTILMLGSGEDRMEGIVSHALREFAGGAEPRFEKYGDAWVQGGDSWWDGKELTLLTVEVENRLAELKGTVGDLLRKQAHGKIGIFYQDHPDLAERWRHVKEVFEYFSTMGFAEAEATPYLIIFGPEAMDQPDGIGEWCAMVFTSKDITSDTSSFVSLP